MFTKELIKSRIYEANNSYAAALILASDLLLGEFGDDSIDADIVSGIKKVNDLWYQKTKSEREFMELSKVFEYYVDQLNKAF